MKLISALVAVATLSQSVFVLAHPANEVKDVLGVKRGAPVAPKGYTPKAVDCPSERPSIRTADKLAPQELDWLQVRRRKTLGPMRDLLERLDITGFDAASYIKKHSKNVEDLPNIGIAASGGGYRALMNGAGALAAFDSRTPNSTSSGHVGGLLQSATYLAGLSGGSWLVGSLYSNNLTTVQSIINGKEANTWDFVNSIFEGPDQGIQAITTLEYFHTVYDQVQGKEDAGFSTTVTDFWGRGLAFQLINANDGGPSYTWSSIADNDFITQGTAPLPIAVADGRAPGTKIVPTNTTIFEFSPWEMGSWDPTVYGFAPMQYVGSNFKGGRLPEDEDCIAGYDSASFVMGTSSTLFNQFALQFGGAADLPGFISDFIQSLLNKFSRSEEDIASWVNPFYRWNPETNPNAHTQDLTLVDGGENLENIPLHPLIQPTRAVDVIIAIDSSADTTFFWPNGTSLVATYQRSLNNTLQNGTAFPSIPDQNTFVNLGLNSRPTFFGCSPQNTSSTSADQSQPPPLIVYLPNAPYTTFSNVSTFDPTYSDQERNAIITNGYNVATRGNASDENWPTCLGCALLRRSLERTNTEFPSVCQQCYSDYCWDGTVNSTEPAEYNPKPYEVSVKKAKKNAAPGSMTSLDGLTRSVLVLSGVVAVGMAVL